MRRSLCLCALLAVCGCRQRVDVPTARQLVADRALLTQWQGKCDTGEYSRLEPARKADLCSTTREATISIAQIAAGKADSDFLKANTKRK